ncbi:pyridoxal-dependent decarboxylase [Microbacterium sp. cx-59]|uniref:pyridoxal phosphate-dependent decarboxylase family protein n=1 Tax=Microbacterium sp. cx-59 TaxID=2891207 RepID=UPI001E479CAB|nr:pyridoxal-dependent decarboxylase [Microbacterium sp. cx-59]MCC4908366.1 aspartate aminotransferase family protein [Microbacterium sp. cx-59]
MSTPDDATDRAHELAVLRDADERARRYIAGIGTRPVYPDATAIAGLDAFREQLPEEGHGAESTIDLLDRVGSAAAVETNGHRYYGFVIGATLPVAAAADRLALAWDNSASSATGSPALAAIEAVAGEWLLDILDLPRESAVGFSTSAASGTVVALAAARRTVLARAGWDLDQRGLHRAPGVRVVASELTHVVVKKALRVLGFGLDSVTFAPTDDLGRIDPERLPEIDARTILILQAGEVNTGEFDPFDRIMDAGGDAAGWVHVDGAFGLWARATAHRELTAGVDRADSWTVDGHKWLNTPYDSAAVIVRDREALVHAMHAGAEYSAATADDQMNRTLEFSRRARGVTIWAALRGLGRRGVAAQIERSVALARQAADGLRASGYTALNRPVLNQVLVRAESPAATARILAAAQASGRTWFGGTVWRGEPAFRISVSSWRTGPEDIADLVALLRELREE